MSAAYPASQTSRQLPKQLSQFIGPMAENSALFNELLLSIVDDHEHWRRNYYPRDGALYGGRDRRRVELDAAELEDALRRLLVELRRSFPFHSPRYVAHQQSELSMPTLLGAVAGMLYNANNVTSESGNATLAMELEATSRLLEMIGFRSPPALPSIPGTAEEHQRYQVESKEAAGWCHLCSGGTSANIEALWVARNVRYGLISMVEAALARSLDVEYEPWPGAARRRLTDLPNERKERRRELLRLRPTAAIELFAQVLDAAGEAESKAALWEAATGKGQAWFELMSEHPPVVFVSGAAHYSVRKAMDVLGLGSGSLVQIDTDSQYRADLADLRAKLEEATVRGQVPLAVIGVIGTTEEGAIDPFDQMVELRRAWERERHQSFWLHADAAWGGYFLTALRPSPAERFERWALTVRSSMPSGVPLGRPGEQSSYAPFIRELYSPKSGRAALDAVDSGRWEEALGLCQLQATRRGWDTPQEEDDVIGRVRDLIGRERSARVESAAHEPSHITLRYHVDPRAVRALQAVAMADSVTVDPHKMGYQPYACGAIAFQRDGVRNFVRQSAPYITKQASDDIVRQPLMHLDRTSDGSLVRVIDSPSPFTLEGSRPSAPAAALWLSLRVLPLHRDEHGQLVASTWRAAQELTTWIDRFSDYRHHFESALPPDAAGVEDFSVDFVVLTRTGGVSAPPDTNLVIFGATIRRPGGITLDQYNDLNKRIHKSVFITAEAGEEQYSYGQPFFISDTAFSQGHYALEAVAPAAEELDIVGFTDRYRAGASMQVLRATVMNPYLEAYALRSPEREPFVALMEHLHRAARNAWIEMSGATAKS